MSELLGHIENGLTVASQDSPAPRIDAEEIKAYLLSHPHFFVENPEVLECLFIPHQQKGSVSLVELQSEQLRNKVRQLSQKLNQLITIAKQNEQIYRIYADLNLRLLRCRDLSESQTILEEVMQDELKLASVSLKVFKGAMAFPEIQRKLFIEKRFKAGPFFFGRLSQHERQLLFADGVAESVALVLLGDDGELGMLAVGSKDPGHFIPEMDTLLLTQLQQFLNVMLANILTY